LLTRIYRELKKLNSPKSNEPIKKWATELNRTLFKEDIQMAKKPMKKYLSSLAKKEMQIKATLRFTSPLLEWLSSRILPTTNVVRMWGKGKPHTVLVGM
jgi:hypothetical protein